MAAALAISPTAREPSGWATPVFDYLLDEVYHGHWPFLTFSPFPVATHPWSCEIETMERVVNGLKALPVARHSADNAPAVSRPRHLMRREETTALSLPARVPGQHRWPPPLQGTLANPY